MYCEDKILKKIFYFKKRILKFQNPNGLVSDEDILNLFLGLVRLIKKNTELIMEEKYLHKISSLQAQIKKLSK